MTPVGIEPATFRLVAQHLNHCATAVPNEDEVCVIFVKASNCVFFIFLVLIIYNDILRVLCLMYVCGMQYDNHKSELHSPGNNSRSGSENIW